MCGRYAVVSSPEALRALFRYAQQPNFPARYNVAPTQPIAIVRLVDGKREFALVRWGLLPPWVKDPKTFTLLINARGETVLDKPAFRNAMRRRRCLIPADGFYEWKRSGLRGKQPYFVRQKSGAPFAFAGLWESWMGPNGEELETAAIVTTSANRTLAPIHERMPVILPPEAHDMWLDSAAADGETAASLIVPAADELLDAIPVSDAVNKVANDNPQLVERAPERADEPPAASAARRVPRERREDDGQASLF